MTLIVLFLFLGRDVKSKWWLMERNLLAVFGLDEKGRVQVKQSPNRRDHSAKA